MDKDVEILELRQRLAEYEEAVKMAVDSSAPYIARHGAFLIPAEAWERLVALIYPRVAAVAELSKCRKAGGRLEAGDIVEVLEEEAQEG
ncbi:hypothetical protein [Desulfovirgula thermocuniculi]|uniref:hypothetical protein n=1 Tax=Desulfovirgula thermocuniculi TaxID=348842 RepID=UPI0004826687|nr:hypothetical protein [Desulfovirgula thermocuniculi]